MLSSNPDDSLLLKVIRHEVEGIEMPEGGAKLSDEVIADFAKWLSMDAPDPRDEPPPPDELAKSTSWDAVREKREQWWSFQPIVRPLVPDDSGPDGLDHPIDRFVHAKQSEVGLTFAKPADRSVLARRLSFAITGLPPAPEVIAQFVNDPSADAYEQYVDRLLQSEHFGEHWARHWMDWIRYAESHGSEGDPEIAGAHHYRDYLIRAFNADVPYDQLVREHIAGDLLESPRINQELEINESQVATAHWRMVFHGFAPTDAMEEKVRFTDDAIDVFSKTFLGLTVSCARCHDHKFDAISQADYYALFGIVGSTRPGRAAIDSPERLNRNRESLAALKVQIRDAIADDWIASLANPDTLLETTDKNSGPIAALLQSLRDADDFHAVWNQYVENVGTGDTVENANIVRHWDLTQPSDQEDWFAYGNGTADQVSPAGVFAINDSGESVLRGIYPSGVYSHLLSDKHAAVTTSPSFHLDGEYDLWLHINGGGSAISRYVVQDYPRNGTVYPFTILKEEEFFGWKWIKYELSYWQGDDIHIELATANDSAVLIQNQDRSWFGIRAAALVPKGTRFDQDRDDHRWMQPILQRAEFNPPNSFAKVEELFRQSVEDAILAWQRNELSDAQAMLLDQCVKGRRLANSVDTLVIAQALIHRYRELELEVSVPRRAPALAEWVGADQALYIRGDHKQPGDTIPRRFLEAFNETPYQTTLSGRSELADDVLSEGNPLTARVITNRIWHHLFGRGIVGTNDNFGRLGQLPTHPELLDYLADEFRTSDAWSIKSMIRRIVTSDTWRQGHWVSDKAKEIDPQNELYSHWSVTRLEAEAIRDAVLSASGQLDPAMFGEAVPGNSARRSVYVRVIRNALDPFLAAFDAPVPFSSKGRRDVTNVPAQSLLMLNNGFVIRAAGKFADRALRQDFIDSDSQRVDWMWREALGRRPSDLETEAAIAYLESASQSYQAEREDQLRLKNAIQDDTDELNTLNDRVVNRIGPRPVGETSVGLNPIAEWSFDDNAKDAIGDLDLRLHGTASISQGALVLDGSGFATTDPIATNLSEKTLEVTVQLATLKQAAGGVMTVQDLSGDVFDSIVYAEQQTDKWLAGSNSFRRTRPFDGVPETEAADRGVHLAITYDGLGMITCYRDGKQYGEPYPMDPQSFLAGEFEVLFGMRHGKKIQGNRMLRGRVLDARLYNRALSAEEINAVASGMPLPISKQEIHAAMSVSERKRRDELQTQIDRCRSKLKSSSEDVTPNQHWIDLAHSLFNMKEFIYVR